MTKEIILLKNIASVIDNMIDHKKSQIQKAGKSTDKDLRYIEELALINKDLRYIEELALIICSIMSTRIV